MRSMKWVLFSLLTVAAVTAFGQPAELYFNYYDNGTPPAEVPMAYPCWSGTVFNDGPAICLFWDNDANGPDADDPQPVVGTDSGQVSMNCFAMNGVALGLGAGFFGALDAMRFQVLPLNNPIYYIQISAEGTCYQSDTFRVTPGPLTLELVQSQLHCVNNACPTTVTPPSAPINVHASDDTRCLLVTVTWDWDHPTEAIGGFTVLRDGVLVGSASSSARSLNVDVFDDTVSQYTVVAFNSGGPSDPSAPDAGSTYTTRWSPETLNLLTGDSLRNQNVVLRYITPEDPSACPSRRTSVLWYNWSTTPVRFGIVAVDSADDTTNCHFPDLNLYSCVIVLADSNYGHHVVFYDTTGVFDLGFQGVSDPRELTPNQFALAQNYPNPFNPSTHISFSVAYEANVRLEVFNIQGQLVKSLLDTRMTAGVHTLEWDGTNNAGAGVGAGVYLYRMVSDNFVQTQKMLFLK
jgi:hypothetical protein